MGAHLQFKYSMLKSKYMTPNHDQNKKNELPLHNSTAQKSINLSNSLISEQNQFFDNTVALLSPEKESLMAASRLIPCNFPIFSFCCSAVERSETVQTNDAGRT